MKKNLRPKKLALKVETLRRLEVKQLEGAQGGGESGIWCVTTITFSEGACETYSWLWSCEAP